MTPSKKQTLRKDKSHQDIHEPIWDGMGRMEERLDGFEEALAILHERGKEECPPYDEALDCCLDCTAAHNAIWAKLDRLEERLDAATKEHHQRVKPTWETWTYSNGGKWIISPEHLDERYNEEHDEEEEGSNDMHGIIIDELILLGERIETLEERLDEAKKAHHKRRQFWNNDEYKSSAC